MFRKEDCLECVDPRAPQLVRCAKITTVKFPLLKINFIGWPPKYDFWIDEKSSDLHPVDWCAKTGHYLESPLCKSNANYHLGKVQKFYNFYVDKEKTLVKIRGEDI